MARRHWDSDQWPIQKREGKKKELGGWLLLSHFAHCKSRVVLYCDLLTWGVISPPPKKNSPANHSHSHDQSVYSPGAWIIPWPDYSKSGRERRCIRPRSLENMSFAWFASTSRPFPSRKKASKGPHGARKDTLACREEDSARRLGRAHKSRARSWAERIKKRARNRARGGGGGGSARGEDAVTRIPNHQGQSSVSSHVSLHTVTFAASLPLGLSSHLRPPELGSHHPHLPHTTTLYIWFSVAFKLVCHIYLCGLCDMSWNTKFHETPLWLSPNDCKRIMWGRGRILWAPHLCNFLPLHAFFAPSTIQVLAVTFT